MAMCEHSSQRLLLVLVLFVCFIIASHTAVAGGGGGGGVEAAAMRPMMASQLARMASDYWRSTVLYLVAKLHVADELAASSEPLNCTQLALRVRAREADGKLDSDAFCRVLRAAVLLDLLESDARGRLSNTAASTLLREDDRGAADPTATLRSLVLMLHEVTGESFRGLEQAVRSGRSGFEERSGRDLWSFLDQPQHREQHDAFHGGMRYSTQMMARGLLRSSPELATCTHFCDFGGGVGALLAEFLLHTPGANGTLFDVPSVRDSALRYLAARGVADRTRVIGGSFFADAAADDEAAAALSTCDCLVMKSVLHDWNDTTSLRILQLPYRVLAARRQRRLQPAGRLFLFELLLTDRDDTLWRADADTEAAPHDEEHVEVEAPRKGSPQWAEARARAEQATVMDLSVLGDCGGRQRSLRHFQALLRRAGLELVAHWPAPDAMMATETIVAALAPAAAAPPAASPGDQRAAAAAYRDP